MKFIILAAGKGSRLFPLVEDMPKSLLDLGGGTTLLERQLKVAVSCPQIKEVLIITGFQHQKIESFLERNQKKFMQVSVEYNPLFEVSDNLVTLWTVRHHLVEGDYIISNGDNLYRDHAIKQVIGSTEGKEGVFATIAHKDHYDSDDMKVLLDKHGYIARVHKQININDAMAESVGLVLVKGAAARFSFMNAMLHLIKIKESLNYYWLEVLNQLVLEDRRVEPILIEKSDWREMDFHPDIKMIRECLLKDLF